MPSTPPGVFIEAGPTLTPPRFGLFTAADLQSLTDPHARAGVNYLPTVTGATKFLPNECSTEDQINEFETGLDWRYAPPITTYTGFTCKSVGVDWDDAEARLLTRLGNGEAPALEATIWAGMDPWEGAESGSPQIGLMAEDTEILTTAAVDLVDGLGELERFFYEQYPGTPVIHTPRELANRLAERRQVDFTGAQATSPLGSRYSFGAYPRTDAAGTEAAAGTAWIVASGQVTVLRDDIRFNGTEFRSTGAGFDPHTNEVFFLAHRTDIVRWDGITAAVLVTL